MPESMSFNTAVCGDGTGISTQRRISSFFSKLRDLYLLQKNNSKNGRY